MLRWGILGAARIADAAVAPAMRAAGHDIAVVGSRSLSRAQAFAASHGARRARGSYEEVLEADDVDAVYVALPNDLHEQWTLAAIAAGKHVLCEKPMALDAEAAARMATAAAGAETVLVEAIMTRFHPRTTALLEAVWAGEVGEVRTVTSSLGFTLDDDDDIRASGARGGGALLDLGVYAVSMARWLVRREPEVVRAIIRPWRTGVDGGVSAGLAFPGGALAAFTASFHAVGHQSLEIAGTKGVLRVPEPYFAGAGVDAAIECDGRVLGTWRADPYEAMLRAFEGALNGADSGLPPEESVATARVLDGLRRAAGRAA